MAVLGPLIRVELAASRYTMSGDADRLSFDLIIQVFEFYRNSSSKEVLNRLVMESRIQHHRVDDAADFPSSDFRSGLRDSLIERAGSSPGDAEAERVLNEITDFTRKISNYESGLLIESVIFIAHKYVTLAKRVFRERKNALMAANNAVDDLIELKLHKECKSCSKTFHSDDKVILLPCSRKHLLLHPGCAEKWCYQCPKCTFPFPNPSIDEGGDSNFDGGFGPPADDGSSVSNGLGQVIIRERLCREVSSVAVAEFRKYDRNVGR